MALLTTTTQLQTAKPAAPGGSLSGAELTSRVCPSARLSSLTVCIPREAPSLQACVSLLSPANTGRTCVACSRCLTNRTSVVIVSQQGCRQLHSYWLRNLRRCASSAHSQLLAGDSRRTSSCLPGALKPYGRASLPPGCTVPSTVLLPAGSPVLRLPEVLPLGCRCGAATRRLRRTHRRRRTQSVKPLRAALCSRSKVFKKG